MPCPGHFIKKVCSPVLLIRDWDNCESSEAVVKQLKNRSRLYDLPRADDENNINNCISHLTGITYNKALSIEILP